jgi:hypothetical protein
LENCDDNVDINNAWENIIVDIKFQPKVSRPFAVKTAQNGLTKKGEHY